MGYFAIWSCILVFESCIKKYYFSSSYSYEQIKRFRNQSYDFDMAEFCESYLVPLLSTERIEFINDGNQYGRSEKTENIADWEIAQKYLNVCVNSNDGTNCSKCSKCMRTMIPLDAMGKLGSFSHVFDVNVYRKKAFMNKCFFEAYKNKNGFSSDIVSYCEMKGYQLPNFIFSKIYTFLHRAISKVKRIFI